MSEKQPLHDSLLQNFDTVEFLRSDWQRNPRVIRRAIEQLDGLPSVDHLAGLALEENIESRLISHCLDSDKWQLEHGPFLEHKLSSLPNSSWTLLIQAVDHYLPEVAALEDYFRFIPRWQIDDIMVSLAAPGGGVGPHFDLYDVFLLQGSGRREWKIGQRCDQHTALKPDTPLNLLADFQAEKTLVLEPGDILYLPPGIAHWGTAIDASCVTYSIGFRSPSLADLLADFSHAMRQSGEGARFHQSLSERGDSSNGEALISPELISELAGELSAKVTDEQQLLDWFGKWASRHKYAPTSSGDESAEESFLVNDSVVDEALIAISQDEVAILYRDGGARFFYAETSVGAYLFFFDGRSFNIEAEDAKIKKSLEILCNQREFPAHTLRCWLDRNDARVLLIELLRSAALTL